MALQKNREILKAEDVESKKLDFKIADLVVPALSLMAFILLTIFVYLPQINASFGYSKKIAELELEQKLLEKNVQIVRTLEEQESQLVSDNNLAKTVVPAKLAVSNFTFDINDLALEHSLNLQSIASSDINANTSDEFQYTTGIAKGITGPLKYDGKFEDVVEFLDLIKVGSPYLIESSEIKINKYVDFDDRWSLDISITGYYMVENKDQKINPTSPIALYTDLADLLDALKARVGE